MCRRLSMKLRGPFLIFSAQCCCSCDMCLLFFFIDGSDCISFFNKVPCEHFFRSVTQQLLYGLVYNSWLYQGGFVHPHTIFVCTHKYQRESMDLWISEATFLLLFLCKIRCKLYMKIVTSPKILTSSSFCMLFLLFASNFCFHLDENLSQTLLKRKWK